MKLITQTTFECQHLEPIDLANAVAIARSWGCTVEIIPGQAGGAGDRLMISSEDRDSTVELPFRITIEAQLRGVSPRQVIEEALAKIEKPDEVDTRLAYPDDEGDEDSHRDR